MSESVPVPRTDDDDPIEALHGLILWSSTENARKTLMQLDDELKELIRARLAAFDVLRVDPSAHRRAQVPRKPGHNQFSLLQVKRGGAGAAVVMLSVCLWATFLFSLK